MAAADLEIKSENQQNEPPTPDQETKSIPIEIDTQVEIKGQNFPIVQFSIGVVLLIATLALLIVYCKRSKLPTGGS